MFIFLWPDGGCIMGFHCNKLKAFSGQNKSGRINELFIQNALKEWVLLNSSIGTWNRYLNVDTFHTYSRVRHGVLQDEKYDHIEAEEIKKVEKAVTEKDQWLNNKCNAQSKLADHQDPAVYTSVILSEKKVAVILLPDLGVASTSLRTSV